MNGRILVVDDEVSLQLTLVANLELEGFDVVGVNDAKEALEALAQQPFDLMVTDIRMPGMNGVELFDRVRELYPTMPVLLMTGFALEGLIDRAVQHGAYTVLPKPFDVDQMVRAISTALKRPIVLVIDDDAPVAETTAAVLEDMGIRARAVFDGKTAIDEAKKDEIDVCVVDMVMPGLNGPQTVAKLTELDRSITCIAISGHDVPELFRQAAPFVFAILRKPVRSETLAQTISKARARAAEG
jgi:DNA-binding NtrC family response regulator